MIRRRKRRSFSALFPLTTASSFSSQVFSPSTPLSSSSSSTWQRLSFVTLRNSSFNSIFLLSSLMAEKELCLQPLRPLQFLKGLPYNGIANILPFSFQCVKKYHFDRIDYDLKRFFAPSLPFFLLHDILHSFFLLLHQFNYFVPLVQSWIPS